MKQRVFIGVAWPYVNGDLHIGHLAGYLLPADIFSRFSRLTGKETLMVSGADCFGTPTTIEADKEGVSPEAIVKKYFAKQKSLFKIASISYDLFTKTTTPNHQKITQEFFLRLFKNGYLSKKTTKQFYSEADKKFLPDRYVEGECPYCHAENTRSDQCDRCGNVLNPEELINPKSKITGQPATLKDTEHYFIEWPLLEKDIKQYFKTHSSKWRPWIKTETENWLAAGLKSRAITRDLDWGVKIPIAELPKEFRLEGVEHKRIYVWFDAVVGYFSASLEWAKKTRKSWKPFWYDSSAKHYYFLGKDNLVFHTIFWPGQLLSYDRKIHLPDYPAINQFLTLEGRKFSKSRGVTISSEEIIKKFGVDAVRFYLTAIMPENSDASFSWDDFKNRVNGSLIGNFGNFVNRVLNLGQDIKVKNQETISIEVKKQVETAFKAGREALTALRFKDYCETFLRLSDFANKYLSEKKPWELKKNNPADFRKTMVDCFYITLTLNLLMKPMMPDASSRLEKQLKMKPENWPELTKLSRVLLRQMAKMKIAKHIIPLFHKIEDKAIEEEKAKIPTLL